MALLLQAVVQPHGLPRTAGIGQSFWKNIFLTLLTDTTHVRSIRLELGSPRHVFMPSHQAVQCQYDQASDS